MIKEWERLEHYEKDKAFSLLHLNDEYDQRKMFLTILYAIEDLSESLDRLSDNVHGYEP